MKSVAFTFVFLFTFFFVNAQNTVSLTGKVEDKVSGELLPYCSVAVFKSGDSTMVNGLLTNENGIFLIEDIAPGEYYLVIQYMGYQSTFHQLAPLVAGQRIHNVGTISLKANTTMLDEVRITSQRSGIENKIDRQVYQADKFTGSQGGNAIDVLKNMPSVTVNSEGLITMRGSSGFLVLLNGKPIQTDPVTILNQIPANTIQNIEIITSPSVSYDVDGKAGIINITTKSILSESRSFSANIQGGLPSVRTFENINHPLRFGADATYNIRTQKWDFSISGNYTRNDMSGRRVGDVNTTINNIFTFFPSDGERSFIRYNYTGRASASFTPDAQNTFSIGIYKGYRFQSRRADIVYHNTKTNIITNETIAELTYFNSNIARKSSDILLGHLDYEHKFKNSSIILFSGLIEKAKLEGLTSNINLAEPDRQSILQITQNPSKNPLDAYRAKVDYTANVWKGKLETGVQYRYQIQKGIFQYLETNPEDGTPVIIPEFSSQTEVVNSIYSVYGQYGAATDKWEYKGGLRYEYAARVFTSGNEPARNLNLSNLFPAVNIQYHISQSLKAKASYNKRVQRSTNNELNPFPEREHSETLESGDPDILPEFIGLSEIGITKDHKKGSVFFTVYNQRINNVVNRVNSIYNDTILNRIYTNAGLAIAWGAELGTTTNINKWWQLYIGSNIYHYKIKGSLFNNSVDINSAGMIFSGNVNTTFRIAPTMVLQGTLNYLSKRVTAQGEDSQFFTPGLSLRKTFLNNRLNATLQWQNIDLGLLGTNRQRITTYGKGFYTTTNYIHETDMFLLNFSYNLNNTSKKSKLPASEFGEREF